MVGGRESPQALAVLALSAICGFMVNLRQSRAILENTLSQTEQRLDRAVAERKKMEEECARSRETLAPLQGQANAAKAQLETANKTLAELQ